MPIYLLGRKDPIVGQPTKYVVRAETAKCARRRVRDQERFLGYVMVGAWELASTSDCTQINLHGPTFIVLSNKE